MFNSGSLSFGLIWHEFLNLARKTWCLKTKVIIRLGLIRCPNLGWQIFKDQNLREIIHSKSHGLLLFIASWYVEYLGTIQIQMDDLISAQEFLWITAGENFCFAILDLESQVGLFVFTGFLLISDSCDYNFPFKNPTCVIIILPRSTLISADLLWEDNFIIKRWFSARINFLKLSKWWNVNAHKLDLSLFYNNRPYRKVVSFWWKIRLKSTRDNLDILIQGVRAGPTRALSTVLWDTGTKSFRSSDVN